MGQNKEPNVVQYIPSSHLMDLDWVHTRLSDWIQEITQVKRVQRNKFNRTHHVRMLCSVHLPGDSYDKSIY